MIRAMTVVRPAMVISTNRPANSQSSRAEGTSFLGETADLRCLEIDVALILGAPKRRSVRERGTKADNRKLGRLSKTSFSHRAAHHGNLITGPRRVLKRNGQLHFRGKFVISPFNVILAGFAVGAASRTEDRSAHVQYTEQLDISGARYPNRRSSMIRHTCSRKETCRRAGFTVRILRMTQSTMTHLDPPTKCIPTLWQSRRYDE